MRCIIETPVADALCEPLGFSVEGWVHDERTPGSVTAVSVLADGEELGRTHRLAVRPEVNAAQHLPVALATGFQVFCHRRRPASEKIRLEVRVHTAARPEGEFGAVRDVRLVGFDYRKADYGHAVDSNFTGLMHREQVYGSGPSLAEGSPHCLALLRKYLGPPPGRVLDVGCGLGYYGRHLRSVGYDWFGVEMKAADCEALTKMGLPHRRVDGGELPFADRSYDAVISVEVLEHVPDPDRFLREACRVAPQVLLSVPNFETVPYLHPHALIPWHLLEADHKNFFTRWSLRHLLSKYYRTVEVTCYHEMPIRTREGTPLFNSLFAWASGPTTG